MEYNYRYRTKTVLIGQAQIAREFGVCSSTIWRWRRDEGFPAYPLPDGRLATTVSLIDHWLMLQDGQPTSKNQSPGRPKKKQGVTPDPGDK